MNKSPTPLAADVLNVVRGMLMGGADAIPGVSGGTVALILRIYTRLVTAISHVDLRLIRLVGKRQWNQAAQHVDLRFLIALGCGIGCGLAVTLLFIEQLLTNPATRPFTLAAFFGMILASCLLVVKLVEAKTAAQIAMSTVLAALGAAAAFAVYWFTTFGHGARLAGDPSYGYIFCCGALAICAMILPGISGAMMLLLLGLYTYVAGSVKKVLSGQDLGHSLLVVVVFSSGCATGLILFSKVLRQLLARFPSHTMAVLCGFMFGALPKLWPFDVLAASGEGRAAQYRPVLPDAIDLRVAGVAAVAAAGAILVLAIDRLAHRYHVGTSNQIGNETKACVSKPQPPSPNS